jgi:hypothetical protein
VAELQIEGDELVLHLSRGEKLKTVHSDLRAPRAAIRSIGALNDAQEPADRSRLQGRGAATGVSEVASVRTGGGGSRPSLITTRREVYASCSRARTMARGSSELPIQRTWRPTLNLNPGRVDDRGSPPRTRAAAIGRCGCASMSSVSLTSFEPRR